MTSARRRAVLSWRSYGRAALSWRSYGRAALSAAIAGSAVAIVPLRVWAQAGPAQPSGGGTVTVPAPAPQPGSAYVPMPTTQISGYGNPQAPNGTIGGGNATESSAHPITGEEEDSFDLGHRGAGPGGVARGDDNGPVFIGGGPTYSGGEVPYSHVVRRGDTLWGLCGFYFQNPYQWPRIWSYNPQIKNPHWIYPGDEVRLKDGGGGANAGGGPGPASTLPYSGNGMTLVDRRRQVPEGTVFLRDSGWIQSESDEIWGTVSGASEDKMFLSDFDETYIDVKPEHEVRLGQELTLFRRRNTAAAGWIVQILGTARIDQYNPKTHVARAKVIESLDVIERGALVGPLARRFEIVPPRRNELAQDVQAHVLASLHPNEFFGQNQVVFIDAGESKGLKPGNRLQIMRRGDAWRRSLVSSAAGYRVSPDDERPMPPMEQTPGARREDERYPDEVVAELRVVAVKKDSSVCVVTQSRVEVELYDLAVARKGY
jgi:hypothetical protein